jgi:hypothetical protein
MLCFTALTLDLVQQKDSTFILVIVAVVAIVPNHVQPHDLGSNTM